MSQAAANKEVVRRFLLAIAAKDVATMRSVLAPEAHLSLMVAGVYSPHLQAFPGGIHWDRDGLIAREIDFQQQLREPLALQTLTLIAEGDSVVAAVLGKGHRAVIGTPYIQHYSYHFQMSRGLIADIRLYQDTFHHWQVWSGLGAGVEPAYMRPRKLATIPPEQTDDPASASAVPEDQVAANKISVRRFLTAVRNRDPQATREAWSPDGIWSFAIGGEYSPRLRAFEGAPRWDLEGMVYMTQNANKSPQEPLHLDVYSLVAEGNQISAEALGFLVRANGRAYRQHYSFHFKARQGKLIEGHVYQDTLHQYDVTLDPPAGGPVAARTSVV